MRFISQPRTTLWTVNSFTGVNQGDFSGGVYNAATVLEGNNLGCFAFQAAQQGILTVLEGILSDLGPISTLVNQYISPVLRELNCSALTTFSQSAFNQFPGYNYNPRPWFDGGTDLLGWNRQLEDCWTELGMESERQHTGMNFEFHFAVIGALCITAFKSPYILHYKLWPSLLRAQLTPW